MTSDEELRSEIEQIYAGYEVGFQHGQNKGGVICDSCNETFLTGADQKSQCFIRIDSIRKKSSIHGIYCQDCGEDHQIHPEKSVAQHLVIATVEKVEGAFQILKIDEMVDWSGPKETSD